MGLLYLACGAVVLFRLRSEAASVFALYAFCAALHWGGPIAVSSSALQLAVWFVYFILSAMLAEATFLLFTLTYPVAWSWGQRRLTRLVIYLPVVLGVLLAGVALAARPEDAAAAWRGAFFTLESVQANLFAATGLIFLLVRFVRAGARDGPRRLTGPMALGAWISVLPWIVAMGVEAAGGAVPGGSNVYTLLFGLMPVSFAYALLTEQQMGLGALLRPGAQPEGEQGFRGRSPLHEKERP